MTPEGKVKKKVKNVLNGTPNCWYTMPATYGYGRSGAPDIIGCFRGFFFAIECKAGYGKVTALQEQAIDKIGKANGVTWVVNDKNVDSFERDFSKWCVHVTGG